MQRGASFNLEAVKAEIEERIGAMKGKMEQRRLFLLPVHWEKVDAPKARPDEGSRPISTKGKTGRSIASGAVRQARGRAPITAGAQARRPNDGLRSLGQKKKDRPGSEPGGCATSPGRTAAADAVSKSVLFDMTKLHLV